MTTKKKQLREWAWEVAPSADVRPSALLVLHALIQRFDPKEGAASPSIRDVARLTGLSQNTVTPAIKALQSAGLVRVTREWGPNRAIRPSRYEFMTEATPAGTLAGLRSGEPDTITAPSGVREGQPVKIPATSIHAAGTAAGVSPLRRRAGAR